jgi:LysR family nitrogen assimilation transcriptional regulator
MSKTILAPRSGKRRTAQSISLHQTLASPLILPADPHGVHPIIEARARAAGLPFPNVAADI